MTVVRAPSASDSHHPIPVAVTAALDLFRRRIMPIPVPYGTKNPSDRKAWQTERYTPANLSAFNSDKLNVGMRLGHITAPDGAILTDKFIDVDLDCPESVLAAQLVLPPTGMMWGRASNPRSHYGYRLTSMADSRPQLSYNDPLNPKDAAGKSDARLIELRFQGQTIAPGSINMESGTPERVRWEPDGDGDPTEVDYHTLEEKVRYIAAIALLARYWRDGIRHDAALPLAGLLCRGGLTEDAALDYVEKVCRVAGESAADIDNRLGCVRDTYAKALTNQPFTGAPKLEDYIDARVVRALMKILDLKRNSTTGNLAPDGLTMTDAGNAERFVTENEGRALWCDDEKQWYVYESGVWGPDRKAQVIAWMKDIARRLYAQIVPNIQAWPALDNSTKTFLRILNSNGGINAALNLAKPDLAVLPEQFDANPWLLNVLDGTVELGKDGSHRVRVHRWQDLCTKQWLARYNPTAENSDLTWYRRTFIPEQDRWEFIEEALGYSLTGVPKRFNFQLIGPSHAGKSMLLRFLKVHSGNYGSALKYSALKADKHDGGDKPRSDLVSLRGARLLTIAEVDGGTVWDTTLFKTLLSGGDAITVRGAYERRGQTFPFTVSMWTSGNDAYGADAADDAAYERVHVIKFEHPMPEGDRDDTREDDIVNPENTGDAFLAAALRGYARLYGAKKGRLMPPDTVREATTAMRSALDPFKEFIETYLEFTGDSYDGILKSDVTEMGRTIWAQNGKGRWGYKTLSDCDKAMERKGATLSQDGRRFANRKYWRGVRWTEAARFIPVVLTKPDWERPTEQLDQ